MQSLRGNLTDEAAAFSVDIEGTLDDADGTPRGEFEFADNDAVMQGFLEGKTFILNPEGAGPVSVKLGSVSTGDNPGHSRAEFSGA